MKPLALAILGLYLCAASAVAEVVPLPVVIDGVQHTVTVDAIAVWRTMRLPDVVSLPNDSTGTVSYRDPVSGTTWAVVADGSIYKDAMPFTGAKVSVLTIAGNGVFGKSKVSGQWSRWDQTYNSGKGAWLLATTALTSQLEPAVAPAGTTAARKSPFLAQFTPSVRR